MNTFFFTLLEDMEARSEYRFEKCERIVKRKKVNLKEYAQVIIPVNVTSTHWFLMVYEVGSRTLNVVDSMKGSESSYMSYFNTLLPFLQDYFSVDRTSIQLHLIETTPQQGNSFDCGLCSCVNLETLSRTGKFDTLCQMYKMT